MILMANFSLPFFLFARAILPGNGCSAESSCVYLQMDLSLVKEIVYLGTRAASVQSERRSKIYDIRCAREGFKSSEGTTLRSCVSSIMRA